MRTEASCARPPVIRERGSREWEEVDSDMIEESQYVIPVAEFAEFTVPAWVSLTREEFQALCDKHPDREQLLHARQQL